VVTNIDSRGVSKKRKLMMSRWRHRKHLTDSAMLSRRELESRAMAPGGACDGMRSCVAFSVLLSFFRHRRIACRLDSLLSTSIKSRCVSFLLSSLPPRSPQRSPFSRFPRNVLPLRSQHHLPLPPTGVPFLPLPPRPSARPPS